MRRPLVALLALACLGAVPRGEPPGETVRRWIAAVLAHQPGSTDGALTEIAGEPAENFAVVLKNLKSVLQHDFLPEKRNDVLRRGALLHTDIALLLPEQAADYRPNAPLAGPTPPVGSLQPRPRAPRHADTLVLSLDGEYLASDVESGHWAFASALLHLLAPDPAADTFVPLWYRAVAAQFQHEYRLGSGTYHMERALEMLPRDPIVLFYAGAMHEALASPRFQSIPLTAPGLSRDLAFPSAQEELRTADGYLRSAVRQGAPLEAEVRLGHVVGLLGHHADAIAILQRTLPLEHERELAYFRELFLGTELAADGRLDQARDSLERAAALFPSAQAPLIAMSDAFRRSGNRAAALGALRRLEALPADARRVDPWWDYNRSYAADADDQLAAVRGWVDGKRR